MQTPDHSEELLVIGSERSDQEEFEEDGILEITLIASEKITGGRHGLQFYRITRNNMRHYAEVLPETGDTFLISEDEQVVMTEEFEKLFVIEDILNFAR